MQRGKQSLAGAGPCTSLQVPFSSLGHQPGPGAAAGQSRDQSDQSAFGENFQEHQVFQLNPQQAGITKHFSSQVLPNWALNIEDNFYFY